MTATAIALTVSETEDLLAALAVCTKSGGGGRIHSLGLKIKATLSHDQERVDVKTQILLADVMRELANEDMVRIAPEGHDFLSDMN